MKVLNAGDHLLSNADVLDWIARKRAQHKREDDEDQRKGLAAIPRPSNFMTCLKRHEREHRKATFQKFALEIESAVQDHLEDEWRDRLKTMTKQQIDQDFAPLQESKCLSETELLLIFNHAPTSVDMLQPMVDSVEERFSAEEQQLLVDVVMSTLRCDEDKATGDTNNG